MLFKTPKFWYRAPDSSTSLIEIILTPISALYKIGHAINTNLQQTKAVKIPVICIGNMTAGGSGKTPTIIALHKLIIKHNLFKSPYFLSRGYGGSESHTRRIDVHEDARTVGDEPLLLASHSNTIISVNRYDGAALIYDLGSDCVLMDDGYQNQTLHKDISILVIDGKTGLGNKKLIPAGPLREPIACALTRADAIIIIGKDKTEISSIIPKHIPVFYASIKVSDDTALDQKKTYIAFAGIAHPRKFFDTLKAHNMNIIGFNEFADHHPYSNKDLLSLKNEAKKRNAQLITTEKDYQRIPNCMIDDIDVLPIEIEWEDEDALTTFLRSNLKDIK